MAQWVNTLDFKDLWKSYDKGEIDASEIAKEVAKRIRSASFYNRYIDNLEEIAEQFDDVQEIDDFDNVLEQLYDWGDTSLDGKFGGKKMCWINTF